MKNNTISVCRVCAMLLIILCHYSTWIGQGWMASIFNVGVQMFLFISGYLYSDRMIRKGFLWKRYKKLCIPMLLWVSILGIVTGNMLRIIQYIFNLQGIGTFYDRWYIKFIDGTGHLWFLTAIMANYILLIAYSKIRWGKRNAFYGLLQWL